MRDQIQIVAAIIFAIALVHTFAANTFESLAKRHPKHAGLLHLLGEVEIVFGFWSFILIGIMAALAGSDDAISYVESRQYTEPLFVFVIMVVAASRPILGAVESLIFYLAKLAPIHNVLSQVWLYLAMVPLLGSFITEPAAMTIAAIMLAPLAFNKNVPEWLKYVFLAVLFVNVSIGGTLTAYAAPPVLMVAKEWGWDSTFMAYNFGWKAAVAVIINASLASFLLRAYMPKVEDIATVTNKTKTPLLVILIHLIFLISIVYFSHHPVIFIGLFLLFLGFTQAYEQYQSPLFLKEGLVVGFFLAGLVILGGMQQWWLQPLVSSLKPIALFFGAIALTAITDNAALTYLGAQIDGLSDAAKYMLMAGAVTGGGLTIIANAPNPAGAALLKHAFNDGAINAGFLLLAALPPTLVAAIMFLI
ncbi:MAG: putative Na+/H+ antiporter [Methylotenera sp.]|nr:putative Na+/H+ antiporter [Methylotenera sp.]